MDSKKRVFCAIFRHFEVPRDGFNSYRIRKIAFISKRLAEKFYCMVQMLQFLPNLKGQVVWSLLSDVWGRRGHRTPCTTYKLPGGNPSVKIQTCHQKSGHFLQFIALRFCKEIICQARAAELLITISDAAHCVTVQKSIFAT